MNRLLAIVASFLMLVTAHAGTAVNTVGSDDGTAVSGFDVVAFHKDGKAVPGDTRFSAEFDGARWIFASEDNLAAFKAKPEAYLPAWGGHCAWAVSEKQISTKKLSGDFALLDGKLYLFSYGNNRKSGAKDDFLYGSYSKAARLRDGERAWPTIKASLEGGTLAQPKAADYRRSPFEPK